MPYHPEANGHAEFCPENARHRDTLRRAIEFDEPRPSGSVFRSGQALPDGRGLMFLP